MPSPERSGEETRRPVARLLLRTTVLYLLVLCLAFAGIKALPSLLENGAQAQLDRGNYGGARRTARLLQDTERKNELLDQCDYAEALALMEAGDYDGASLLFSSLGDYADARDLAQSCLYQKADRLFLDGQLDAAAELFEQLGPFEDAAERRSACLYEKALDLLEEGQRVEAALLLDSLGPYGDAPERTAALAREISGETDPEAALNALRDLCPEELAHREELTRAREALPKDLVAVGFFHTLGLCRDGTVLACGSNDFGQCDVSSWTEVTAVAAGAYHSLALRSDGTVLAAGRDSEGQCQVSGWTDIVQIAAADYASFGLKRDGTLVYTGFNDYSSLAAYDGIRQIAAGSYGAAVLLSDGSAAFSQESALSERFRDLVGLDLNTGYAVGLFADGSVFSPALDLSGWQDVLAVSAGGNGVLGLSADGRVLSAGFRSGSAPDFSSVTDAVAIAAGGTHWAVVRSDGIVLVLGDSGQGQRDTGSWRLFDSY